MAEFADAEADVEVLSVRRYVAGDLADLLSSGLTGLRLLRALRTHFPDSHRTDIYFGIALGISLLEADRIELLHELALAQREVDLLRGRLRSTAARGRHST